MEKINQLMEKINQLMEKMNNFLNNIVMNRYNIQIILTDKYGGISRRVAYNSIDENDIISIKNINKIEKPIYSRYRNQTFNILDKDTVNTLLNQI